MDRHTTVLIIDDEMINITALRVFFEREGYEVLTAQDGPSGRRLASERIPDFILLDVMMPGESGYETCVRLKEDQDTADIPVMFLTCLDDVASKVNGLSLGAVDYITKPFSAREVLARTKAHLENARRHQGEVRRMADRLQQVRRAQLDMLTRPEDVPGARFAIRYLPVLEAGGDFYEVLDLGGGCYGYFVADVSGHDLGASFVTSSLKAVFRQFAGPEALPDQVLRGVNEVLRAIVKPGAFVTACYALLDRAGSRLVYSCAGHPAPVYLDAGGKAVQLAAEGDILGAFPSVSIQARTLKVRPGDRLFLFTDGLAERARVGGMSLGAGLAALAEACESQAGKSLDGAVDDVVGRMVRVAGPPTDDLVLLGLEV